MQKSISITKDRKNFSCVPNALLNDKKISLSAKGIYAFMDGKPAGWNFTIRSMARQLKEGETAISNALKDLKDNGWLSYFKNSDGTGVYHIYWEQQAQDAMPPADPKPENPNVGYPKQGKPQRISKKDSVVRKIDKELNVELKPDLAETVIKYLNKVTGSSYRAVESNKRHINARIKEGASAADFKAVIDRKCSEWLDSPSMAQYLRPATLFNAEKFNNYLGQIGTPIATDTPAKAASNAIDFDSTGWMR